MSALGELKAISDFAPGARVTKPSARPFDFAYGRMGTIHRELFADGWNSGVLWDGGGRVIGYSADTLLAPVFPPVDATGRLI